VRIENAFTVSAPLERVFGVLADLEQVAPCMPGATIVGEDEAGGHRGRFRIKVGPVSAAYEGRIAVESADAEHGQIVLSGSGSDPRGAGSAEATITASLTPDAAGGGTRVVMGTDLEVGGRLAQFGGRSSMMQGIADRMIGQFAERLQQELVREPAAADAPAPEAGERNGSATPPPAPAAAPASAAAPEEEDAFDAGSALRDVIAVPPPTTLVAVVACFVVGLLLGRRAAPRAAPARSGRRIEIHF
jgi:carbon monoxide dehydrogenase subunit G